MLIIVLKPRPRDMGRCVTYVGICTLAGSSSILSQKARVACMVGPKLCLCFHSSLKIQCQKGHSHPSLRGKNKLGRDDGVNNSGSVLNSFCPDLKWRVCTHMHIFVCMWVCAYMRQKVKHRSHPPYFIESRWGLRLAD